MLVRSRPSESPLILKEELEDSPTLTSVTMKAPKRPLRSPELNLMEDPLELTSAVDKEAVVAVATEAAVEEEAVVAVSEEETEKEVTEEVTEKVVTEEETEKEDSEKVVEEDPEVASEAPEVVTDPAEEAIKQFIRIPLTKLAKISPIKTPIREILDKFLFYML